VSDDPFVVLGLDRAGAGEADVRAARRRLAQRLHPDHGGDAARMRAVNEAAQAALAILRADRSTAASPPVRETVAAPRGTPRRPGRLVERDDASFTVAVLPVEAHEALVVVASWLGQVLLDESPYVLECYLEPPVECFCRLELFPEAGGSMVAITVVTAEGATTPPPSADDVRDAFIDGLRELGPAE
jgi:hypothetical protein